jgi:hypothetical protein
MKRIAVVVACVAVMVASASCDKGTLGTPGGGGQTGTVTGFGGVSIPTSRAGAGGFFGEGSGGAGAPDGGPGFDGSGTGAAGGSFGGRGAPGGSGFTCTPPPSSPCGVNTCGNGSIDTCQVVSGAGCVISNKLEECDGDQFGGDSCARRGYASGSLTCSSVCTIDETTCGECMPLGGALVSCGPAPIAFPYLAAYGIAATDTEVGVAQVDANMNTATTRLTFARLDRNLGVLGVTGLEDTGQAGPLQGTFIESVAVAPMPSGWLVAACAGSIIFVDVLDSTGKHVARTVIDDGTDGTIACLTGTLALAARPTGGALMTWGSYYNWAALLIGADGLPTGEPQMLVDSSSQDFLVGAPAGAWIGDAYYVALPTEVQSSGFPIVVRMMRVAADGTLSKVADILKDEFSITPGFAAGAADIRLIYDGVPPGQSSYNLSVMLRRLGPMGQLLSGPITLGRSPTYYGRAPAVAFGDDTVVLLNGNEQELLTIVRVDAAGKIAARQDVAAAPAYPLVTYDVVRRGPDAVVAWMRPGGPLMLARVMP